MNRLTPDLITVLGIAAVITPFLAFYPEKVPAVLAPPLHLAAVAKLREVDSKDQPELGDLDAPGVYAVHAHMNAASIKHPGTTSTSLHPPPGRQAPACTP